VIESDGDFLVDIQVGKLPVPGYDKASLPKPGKARLKGLLPMDSLPQG